MDKQKEIKEILKEIENLKHKVEKITTCCKEQKYYRVKTDKDRVFNFIKCEVRDDDVEEWSEALLFAYISKEEYGFIAHKVGTYIRSYKQCRIPEFNPDNPPPVDTVVKNLETNNRVYHFSKFGKEHAMVWSNGLSSKTEPYKNVGYLIKYTFTDFPESDFEEIE